MWDEELNFAEIPCLFSYEQDFGLEGFPVVKKLRIRHRELCGDPKEEMISGTVLIHAVP